MADGTPAIGIIGGSGLYQMDEVRDPKEHKIKTPFGAPSDTLIGGKIGDRQIYFLPRHADHVQRNAEAGVPQRLLARRSEEAPHHHQLDRQQTADAERMRPGSIVRLKASPLRWNGWFAMR